jgi:hypothetical protein
MYAVVRYLDSDSDYKNSIYIRHVSNDLEYAKKVAIHFIKRHIFDTDDEDNVVKIAINYCNDKKFIKLNVITNEIIINYKIVHVNQENEIFYCEDIVYAVIEIDDYEIDVKNINDELIYRE